MSDKLRFALGAILILALSACGGNRQPPGALSTLFRCPADMLMGYPAWSPDGSQIAFVRSSGSLSTYHSIVTVESGELLDIPYRSTSYMIPTWTADGSGLIYYFQTTSRVDELHHVQIDTLVDTPILTAKSQEYPNDFSASPDGEHLLVYFQIGSVGSVLQVMDMDGQNAYVISGDLPRPMMPAWSPDGTRIAFFNSIGGIGDLWIVDLSGTNLTTLMEGISAASDPLWSPDGSKIAFLANDSSLRLHDLMVIDIESGDVLTLAENVIYPFGWEADGNAILHMTDQGDVMRAAIDLSDSQIVLPDMIDARASGSFSPDGTTLAYIGEQSGLAELYTVDLASGEITRLTHNPGHQRCFK